MDLDLIETQKNDGARVPVLKWEWPDLGSRHLWLLGSEPGNGTTALVPQTGLRRTPGDGCVREDLRRLIVMMEAWTWLFDLSRSRSSVV